MTDYERWVQQALLDVAAEEKHEQIYKECAIDEMIAHITNQNVSDTQIRNTYRKAQTDAERDLFR